MDLSLPPPTDLRAKIAQLIFIRFGSNMSPKVEAADDLARVSTVVREQGIGGVLFFNGGTRARAAASLAALQACSPIPLTVAADMERGLAQQVSDLIAWPHALAFDALGESAADAVESFARLTAAEARQIGVHVSFSPVADIHRNPQNPIIANRACARTPARAAELAAAYVRGCHAAGLMCCAKHFPGHGNTHEDSHAALPVVDESRSQLEQTDFLPFRELVSSGVEMFMTAHVAYPALDPSGLPATLSRAILTDLLRDEWGYPGAVVSDSLKMDGASGASASEGELAVRAVDAGVDLLLDVTDVLQVIDALERAAVNDEGFAHRIAAAFNRAWHIKEQAFRDAPPNAPAAKTLRREALQVAKGATRVVRNPGDVSFPLPPKTKLGFLLVNPLGDNAYTKTENILETFEQADQVAAVCAFGPGITEADAETTRQSLVACDVVLVAVVVKPFAWHDATIPAWQTDLVNELCGERPVVVASLGIEETLRHFPRGAAYVVTDSDAPVSQDALAELVLGSVD